MLTEEFKRRVVTPSVDTLKKKLEGKTFSILGDSISTGGELAWTSATNYYGSSTIKGYGFKDPTDCWWHYLISDLGMELMVNNSWGGRCLTVINDFDTSGRAHKDGTEEGFGGCHIRELRALGRWSGPDGWSSGHLVERPDYIIIRLGVNDFNGGYTCELNDDGTYTKVHAQEPILGDYDGTYPLEEIFSQNYFDINYRHAFAIREKTDPLLKNFSNAYALTLSRLQRMYPRTKFFCCTLSPFDANGDFGIYPELNDGTDENGLSYHYKKSVLTDFNDRIRQLSFAFGCGVIEHATCGITYQNFKETMYKESNGRYLHPNVKGSKLMGETAVRTLISS